MPIEKKTHQQGGRGVAGWQVVDVTHVFAGTTSPRHVRVIEALLKKQRLAREQVDRISGSSNGPDIIAALRRKGLNIPCVLREGIDRDGRPCKTGEYSLTESDRAALSVWWRERSSLMRTEAIAQQGRAGLIVASGGHQV